MYACFMHVYTYNYDVHEHSCSENLNHFFFFFVSFTCFSAVLVYLSYFSLYLSTLTCFVLFSDQILIRVLLVGYHELLAHSQVQEIVAI